MKTITKALVGTIAAGAMAMASSAPASAQSRYDYRDRHDGISAGDVIAGAVVLGGIAAVASSVGGNYGGYYNGNRGWNGYNNGYGYNGYNTDPRQAVQQCVAAAENQANRYSYGGRANVTDIRNIDRTRDGYRISGRIAVNQQGRDWRGGDRRYGQGWGNDYRGWNDNYRGYDAGKFTCRVSYGRVVDLDFSGIRGL
jgi:hypothetical protein